MGAKVAPGGAGYGHQRQELNPGTLYKPAVIWSELRSVICFQVVFAVASHRRRLSIAFRLARLLLNSSSQ